MKIYIAAPLFSEAERQWNIKLNNFLNSLEYKTYLPQKDGGIAFNLIKKNTYKSKIKNRIFLNDLKEIKKCDIILCVLDGRSPDEGVCVELGMAYVLGKKCIGYKTDTRIFDKHGDNLMIDECLVKTVTSNKELEKFLRNIK